MEIDDARGVAAAAFDDLERRQPAQLVDEQAAEVAARTDDEDSAVANASPLS